jgi:hypothetical protein
MGTTGRGVARFKLCALVSNSGALKNSGLGGEIDAHEAVFRINNAPTKGYEKDVGRGAPRNPGFVTERCA